MSKLIAAADELGLDFEQGRMDEIARRSGVPRTTLYYYFSGREEVLAAVLYSALDEMAAEGAAAAAGVGAAGDRLQVLVRAYLENLLAHPATSKLLVANLGRDGLADVASRLHDDVQAPLRQLIVEGNQDGSLRLVEDPHLAAAAIFGAVLVVGLQHLYLTGTIDVDRLTDGLLTLFLAGIG